MPSPHVLSEGFTLMAYGMGFVFVFLTVLVVATSLMSRVIDRYFPQAPPAAACPIRPPGKTAPDDADLLAILSAAIHRYRSTR